MTRVRFAPSPTGMLHLGSARTATLNWLFCRSTGGEMVLRIEDTDPVRSKVEFEESILDDLHWLGLNWNEGPGIEGPHAPYRQSARGDIYREHADRLLREGKAYPCYCTAEELEERKQSALAEGRPPLYDRTCLALSSEERARYEAEGRPHVIRFQIPAEDVAFDDVIRGHVEFSYEVLGDFIILRSDGSAGFNFTVVVDDATMGITHVIRGEDHLTNTARHIMLFRALGYPVPIFAHHSLLFGPDGTKLSKRHGATTVRQYREAGFLPQAIINYLALLSWAPPDGEEVKRPDELAATFDLSALSGSPAIFDRGKVEWLNGRHIRSMSREELAEAALPFAGEWASDPRYPEMMESVRDNLVTLDEVPGYLDVYDAEVCMAPEAQAILDGENTPRALEMFIGTLEAQTWDTLEQADALAHSFIAGLKEQGIPTKQVLMPVRAAVTGRTRGPSLTYLLHVFGREECLKRARAQLPTGI